MFTILWILELQGFLLDGAAFRCFGPGDLNKDTQTECEERREQFSAQPLLTGRLQTHGRTLLFERFHAAK